MPDLDLKPDKYREKGRRPFRKRVTRAQKIIIAALGIWAVAVLFWTRDTQTWQTMHPLIAFAISFGPGLLYIGWLAFTDD